MTSTTVPTPTLATDTMQADRYKAAFVFVTPDIAARWMERNDRNRRPLDRVVARYVRDMEAGNWPFTGEAVKFADDGRLLDGQHRLAAIIATGTTQLMLVVRGLDAEAQKVMDTGRKRTVADAIYMDGTPNATLLASVGGLVVAWRNGQIKHAHTQFLGERSTSEILDVVATDPTLAWAVHVATTTAKIRANRSAVGFATWLAAQHDPESIQAFLVDVAEMRTNGSGDPRHTLLVRLAVARDQNQRLTSIQQAWLIVRAWDAYRKGESLKQLKMSSAAGPAPFPDLSA